jgi:hypothetical protein
MKQPILVGLMLLCSMTFIGQTEKIESNKESWYFKAVDRISHKLPQPNFRGQLPNRDVYVGTNNKLAREKV